MASAIEGWKQWLNNHPTNAKYNDVADRVKEICCDSTSATAKFEKLTLHKNLVLLTKAPLGTKIQTTFFHSTIGIPIIETDVQHVARIGMSTGSGMELEPSSLFVKTESKHRPTLVDMMKVTNVTELDALEVDVGRAKRKSHCYALLTPLLTGAIQSTDMKVTSVFTTIIETIKAQIVPPADGVPVEDEDTILSNIAAPYDNLLYFLWACHKFPEEVISPPMQPFENEAALSWDTTTREVALQVKANPAVDLTCTGTDGPTNGAITAITKLSNSMIRHQEAALRKQEEKDDTSLKSWRRLPKLQQQVILLGGVEEDGTIPNETTEEMAAILGCQNGAQVDQFLHQSMSTYNMRLEPGFCTAINKGILVCPDDTQTPKNLTPFLTPPANDDDDDEENANLLKMAVQEKYDSKDLRLLTKMDISIPMKTADLKHHVKNFKGCVGRIFGQSSMIFDCFEKLQHHIEDHETRYDYEYKQDKLFGGSFLDRVNWRIHRFLDSCACGDASKIDTKKLCFEDMMEQVERREFQSKVPAWIKKIMKKKEPPPHDEGDKNKNTGGGSRNGMDKRRRFQEGDNRNQRGGRGKRLTNANIQASCKLSHNEPFRDIFHPGNVRDMTKPTKKNGHQMCLRFHTLGYCFDDCNYKSGHGTLDTDEAKDLKDFNKKAKENRNRFQNQRRGGGNQPREEAQNVNNAGNETNANGESAIPNN